MAVMSAFAQDFCAMKKSEPKPPPPEWVAAGKKLGDALRARGISPSEWGRILYEEEGLKSGYQNARNWRNGRGFNTRNQRRCIRIINSRPGVERLPDSYFNASGRAVADLPLFSVRNADLAALLNSDHALRESTVEVLLALDKVVVGDAGYWEGQAQVHEGMAAMAEARARMTLPKMLPSAAKRKRLPRA